MGITKTLSRARTTFYWPGISVAIKDICLKCETCLKYSNKQMKESLGLVPSCTEAWEAVATDHFEFQGNSYLIVACCFSGYIFVRKVKDHAAQEPSLLWFLYLQSMVFLKLSIVIMEKTI